MLDAAAYGVNIVEREVISFEHPSNFILVGTMNPAEGELRPQLSDRIGLHITVHSIMDLEQRVKIMERREEFERNPLAFKSKYQDQQDKILTDIIKARKILKKVNISRDLMEVIAYLAIEMGADGHRADIAILKASKTIAAYNFLKEVNIDHVEEAALLVLGERFDKKSQNRNKINQMIQKAQENISKKKDEQNNKSPHENNDNGKHENPNKNEKIEPNTNKTIQKTQNNENATKKQENQKFKPNTKEENINSCEEGFDIKKLLKIKGKKKKKQYGKRVDSTTQKGKYVKSKLSNDIKNDIAIDATLRAAAIHSNGSIKVKSEDIRHKVRKHGAKASIAIVVDISGSMFSERKSERVKDILVNVIEDAGRKGDKISVIGFKGKEALVIIPTTKRATSFKQQIDNIKIGGTTPLASGMKKGFELLKKERFTKEYVPMMLILTDGMPNIAINENPTKDALKIAEELKMKYTH